MTFDSNDLLGFLASPGTHIARDSERFGRPAWVLKAASGHDLEVDLGGFAFSPVEVPEAALHELSRSRLLCEDGRDTRGDALYRAVQTTRIAA
jgi:hypothetical protein